MLTDMELGSHYFLIFQKSNLFPSWGSSEDQSFLTSGTFSWLGNLAGLLGGAIRAIGILIFIKTLNSKLNFWL